MLLKDIVALLNAKTLNLYDASHLNREIIYISSTDLMSDALAMVCTTPSQTLLLTGLCNAQSLRTAEMMDIQTIIYCRDKALSEENCELADDMEINIFSTPYSMFDAIGLLYTNGLKTATKL